VDHIAAPTLCRREKKLGCGGANLVARAMEDGFKENGKGIVTGGWGWVAAGYQVGDWGGGGEEGEEIAAHLSPDGASPEKQGMSVGWGGVRAASEGGNFMGG